MLSVFWVFAALYRQPLTYHKQNKNLTAFRDIIFTSNWIFPRARAHMRARKCALRTNAHNARTRVRLYPNINKICILLVYLVHVHVSLITDHLIRLAIR